MFHRVHLRTLLGLVVLTTLVSFGLFAGFLVLSTWQQQREIVSRQNEDLAAAVSAAVDQEVEHVETTLRVLARLRALARDDLAAFEENARRLMPHEAGWHAILVTDAAGRLLMSTAASPSAFESGSAADWAEAVIRDGRPFYSSIGRQPGAPGYSFIVAVPVVIADRLQYVIGAQVATAQLSAVLAQQESPPGGVLTLIDRDLRVLARTRNEDEYRGELPAPDFQAAASRMDAGSWESTLLEGTPAYASLKRSALTRWTVGLGMAKNVIDGPLRRTLWTLGGVGALLLIAGGWSVLLLARGIVPALDGAARAARGLARGEPVPGRRSRIVEVASLFDGLRDAASTLADRRRERDEAERSRDTASVAREHALVAEKAAREEAEQAVRVKDEFLMAISHELRTPLTAIRGWARMLQQDKLEPPARRRALETIDRNAHALTQLVNDLLDVSQSQTGKLRLELRPVELGEVVQAAVDAVQPAASARGLAIDIVPVPQDAVVCGDPDRLQQVIWNLVANAVKFTPPGGQVQVAVTRAADFVEIRVSDNGPGIDPEFLPYVFDRFRQGSGGSVRSHRGLGLGLSIVRHLTEMHGGNVYAANNHDGPGATFRVVLPPAA